MRTVALVNRAAHLDSDELAQCVAALQTQVSRDFAPLWGIDARLRVCTTPDDGDEVIWLTDDVRQANVLLPTLSSSTAIATRPTGVVLIERNEPWQITASHEVLELLVDPLLRLAAEARQQDEPAWMALEVCDPVAGESYEIDEVPVANFVLPSWFLTDPLPDEMLVDFLGRLADPLTLVPTGCAAWSVAPGCWQLWCAKRCPSQRRRPPAFSRLARRIRE